MALIRCNECGNEFSDQATACPSCGLPNNTQVNSKFCKHCGQQIDKECVVCPKCGKQVESIGNPSAPIYINNSASSSASAAATATIPTIKRKLPWYLSTFWIIILGLFTGGLYWIVGIILRILWKSHN